MSPIEPEKTLQDLAPPLATAREANRLRVRTLVRLRSLAIIGQSLTVLGTAYVFGFDVPVVACFLLIGALALFNLLLRLGYPPAQRLSPATSTLVLGFDILQLAGLLFLTGGLGNPFSLLICVPVIIASASLPVRNIIVLGFAAVAAVTVLAFFKLPLPWYDGTTFELQPMLLAGIWASIVSTSAFAAFYAYRVSAEGQELALALAATEMALQREQHLSALDGLAAAAAHELGTPLATITLVVREMEKELADDDRFGEDVHLLKSQSQRCRDIIGRLATLSHADEAQLLHLPLTSLIEEVSAPHREFGVTIEVDHSFDERGEPVGKRNPGILYGLGNLVENAVDFAVSSVRISSVCVDDQVKVTIRDDGPGFSADILARIGDPYVTRRTRKSGEGAGGLGLGLFIAKTLLERSGAALHFTNGSDGGALVTVIWPRSAMENDDA